VNERLAQQLRFIVEIDALKEVVRRTYVASGRRLENSAEHSWHLAMMAMVLAEHADQPVDVARVVTMLLVHDIVEVDAGDTYVYDASAGGDKAERERAAAERLFGLLPPDQGESLRTAWEEFEAADSREARFAAALDRLQPVLLNVLTLGRSWREHGITAERVLARNSTIAAGSAALWEAARGMIEQSVRDGQLAPGPDDR
jgi:putative hydrolase of HD superfamily